MREIKLRHFDGKYMQYSDEHGSLADYLIFFNDRDNEELLCTGLKDKNGVCVYEHDIVSYQHQKYDKEPNIAVIKYNHKLCAFTINDKHFSSIDTAIHTLEVIGNIYENKELLDG